MKARTTMRWMKRAWIITGILFAICVGILAATPMYVAADAGGSPPTTTTQPNPGTTCNGSSWDCIHLHHSGGTTRGN